MSMNQFFKIAAISTLVVSLAACTHKNTTEVGTPAVGTNEQAQTYALGQKNGLTGAEVNGESRGHRYVNPRTAPSHQVYYFGYDQSHLDRADIGLVNIQADYLKTHSNAKVRLEGNADDRGSREYNIALGWRRAKSVERVLAQRGVKKHQIQVVSYGKERPAVRGENEEAYRLNRRVELVYVRE